MANVKVFVHAQAPTRTPGYEISSPGIFPGLLKRDALLTSTSRRQLYQWWLVLVLHVLVCTHASVRELINNVSAHSGNIPVCMFDSLKIQ